MKIRENLISFIFGGLVMKHKVVRQDEMETMALITCSSSKQCRYSVTNMFDLRENETVRATYPKFHRFSFERIV